MESKARITIIARSAGKPDIDWNYAACEEAHVAFVEAIGALRSVLDRAIHEIGLDIGRVIVDRAGNADELLALLAELPAEFAGDVAYIRDDGTGVLSATARGGDRVLYTLTPRDVRFYLEANDLVTGRLTLEVPS